MPIQVDFRRIGNDDELTPEERKWRESEARRFKDLLKQYGVTAAQFARWANISVDTVYSWTRVSRRHPAPKWAWRFLEMVSLVPDARAYAIKNWKKK